MRMCHTIDRVRAVALRKESVDRNNIMINQKKRKSLSARRAWIEISLPNLSNMEVMSLSARRAWIEMSVML